MSDRNDKQFVQHSIDTGLADLQGNPFLAQRIMNQERTDQPVMKKKISFAFILAIILLLACAATAARSAAMFPARSPRSSRSMLAHSQTL